MHSIDIDKAHQDLERAEQQLASHHAKTPSLESRVEQLRAFIRMTEHYQTAPNLVQAAAGNGAADKPEGRKRRVTRTKSTLAAALAEVAATPVKRRTRKADQAGAAAAEKKKGGGWGKRLKRNPDNKQTKIALALVETFKPGEILTAQEADTKLPGEILENSSSVSTAHWLSSFLVRESKADNGVLEPVSPGEYRMRHNAAVHVLQ